MLNVQFFDKLMYRMCKLCARVRLTRSAIFIRVNAAAFIKFLAFPMCRRLEGGVYFEITFFNQRQQLL